MVDNNNKDSDFEPFDDDDEAPDIELDDGPKLPAKEAAAATAKKEEKPEDDDLLLEDTPKVSQTTQKNYVLIGLGSLIAIYFVYQFTIGKAPDVAPQPKTEKERMEQKAKGSVAQTTEPIPQIDETEQVKPTDIIPPAPPPPVIEPPSDISISPPIPGILKNRGGASGGGSNAGNNPPSAGVTGDSGLPPLEQETRSDEQNPLFDNDQVAPTDEIPGLPPMDDSDGIGEPPGSGDIPQQDPALEDEQKKQEEAARMQAPMMFLQGPESLPSEDTGEEEVPVDDEIFTLNPTPAEQTMSTKTWHLDSVILQGKVIDAVLETPINTDLAGRLRAIVSRDVYAESGKRILIPKGSRLIGAFDLDNQEFKFGRSRVLVIWTRVIRPDGIDAVFDEGSDAMIGTDFLGRAGVVGEVDNRFMDIFGSAILLSSITVAFAYAAEEITGATNNTQVGAQGQVIDTSSPTTQAVRQAVDRLGGDVTDIAGRMFETRPRITIDQGTRIKIFVNRDIRFDRPLLEMEEPIEIVQ